jgi:hypothetical protein
MDNSIIWLFILSVFSIVFGMILLPKGAPYNITISTFHKIFSFALGLVYLLILYIHINTLGIQFFPLLTAIVTMVAFIVSVVTGSIMLRALNENREMVISHRISSIIAYGLGIYSLYLLDIL